jgi:hypothetical protein
MTAVNLSKLNHEIYELLDFFTRPEEFHSRLREFFTFYSVQVFRSGQLIITNSRTQKYHLPLLVVLQLERLTRKRCQETPDAAIRLFDELVTDRYEEITSFSASILGSMPVSHAQTILSRIQQQGILWQQDDRLLDFLQRSSSSMIVYAPQTWLDFLEEALPVALEKTPRYGLLLLQTSIMNDAFVNIPFFYRHFLLFFPKANLRYRHTYLAIINELYQRYPTESLHFFEQSLLMVDNETTKRIFRKFMPTLPEASRLRFRELLKR